jgi:hypothetical protein
MSMTSAEGDAKTVKYDYVRQLTRKAGEAGHVDYHVDVQTGAGLVRHFIFSGNIFVGPVALVSITEDGRREDELIREPRRFGEFVSPDWIRRFLAARLQPDPA